MIVDDETADGRRAALIAHMEGDFARRRRGEEQRGVAAETQVLRALSNVEAQCGLAFAGSA